MGAADPVTTNGPAAQRCACLSGKARPAGFALRNGHTQDDEGESFEGGGIYSCTVAGNHSAFEEESMVKVSASMVLVVGVLVTGVAYGAQVDPSGGWDQAWEFDTDTPLPATLAAGAEVSLSGTPTVAEISGGTYKFGNSASANSSFTWAGTNYNGDAAWTFDMRFRLTDVNRERYNLFGWASIPMANKQMMWNFDDGTAAPADGLYFHQHDAWWSTKISDAWNGWHVARITHDPNTAKVRVWFDYADEALRNNSYGAMNDYDYDGFAFGGGTGAAPKNWEIDYIRFADEYVPGPPIAEPTTAGLLVVLY